MKFYPEKKGWGVGGGGVEKVLAMLKGEGGRHTRF